MINLKKWNWNNKKLKYGSVAVLLSVVFIALVIVINLILTALSSRYGLSLDLTEEQLYGISDETRELLRDLDTDVKIIFTVPLDQLDNNEYMRMVKSCAQEYEREFGHVTLEYLDMIRSPNKVNKYRELYEVTSSSVIVESPLRFRVFDMKSFFTFEETTGNLYGFNGEYRFTTAILQATGEDVPVVTFTQGHGEEIPAEFEALFIDLGFSVEKTDLNLYEMNKQTKILVVSNPSQDFTGLGDGNAGVSETAKLSAYLLSGGHAMMFFNPDTPALKNLDELLYEWGITVEHGKRIYDNSNALSTWGNLAVLADYTGNELGQTFNSTFKSKGLKTVLLDSVPVSLHATDDSSRLTSSILSTYATAQVSLDSTTSVSGPFHVMVVSSKLRAEDNAAAYSHLLVCGSTYFIHDSILKENASALANDDILTRAVGLMAQRKTSVGISFKPFADEALLIDTNTGKQWLVRLVTVLPGLVLLLSVAVFLKRRHL